MTGGNSESPALTDLAEAELVARAQQRDQAAFAELMRRNTSMSLRLALSVLKDRQEAEDQVQTSFLKAWMGLGAFQSEAKFSTWFRRIVLNQSLMRLRVTRRAKVVSLDEPMDSESSSELRLDPASSNASPEASLATSQIHAHLRQEVRKLPPLLREVLELRDFLELSTEAVAARLDISESAVKSRLSRARAMLRDRMERHVGQSPLSTT